LPTLQILAKVAATSFLLVASATKLQQLVTIFDKHLTAQLRQITASTATPTGQERARNMIRSFLRVIYVLDTASEM